MKERSLPFNLILPGKNSFILFLVLVLSICGYTQYVCGTRGITVVVLKCQQDGFPGELPLVSVDATALPDSICEGSITQLNAAVTGGTGPYTYSWSSLPAGFSSSLPDPEAFPEESTWYYVTVTDASLETATDSVLVTIRQFPPVPGAINGPAELCAHGTADYYIMAVPGASHYSWTVPEDAVINSGQNTDSINVTFGSTSANISVVAGNDCGNSNPSVLAIILSDSVSTPDAIEGPGQVCRNILASFSIQPVPGSTGYLWTVPPDASITEGQNTTAVNVLWGHYPGSVSVKAENSCGYGGLSSIWVITDSVPAVTGLIAGNDTICIGLVAYVYQVVPVPGALQYIWTLPAGASFDGEQDTSYIKVLFSEVNDSGKIAVYCRNLCGTGPEISKIIVSRNCSGISENQDRPPQIRIYPNPAGDKATIAFSNVNGPATFIITTMDGRILFPETNLSSKQDIVKQVDLSGYPDGMYLVKLVTGSTISAAKLAVRKSFSH